MSLKPKAVKKIVEPLAPATEHFTPNHCQNTNFRPNPFGLNLPRNGLFDHKTTGSKFVYIIHLSEDTLVEYLHFDSEFEQNCIPKIFFVKN